LTSFREKPGKITMAAVAITGVAVEFMFIWLNAGIMIWYNG
jgi:hypothetical protein